MLVPVGPPRFRLTRVVFLRLLALTYLAAFLSLGSQVHGLVGERGLLPAREFLAAVRAFRGDLAFWLVPTLGWLGAGDTALSVLGYGDGHVGPNESYHTDVMKAARVAFLAPSLGLEHGFYDVFTDVMRAAAGQLGMDLQVVDCVRSAARMVEAGRAMAQSGRRPDYVLLPDYLGTGQDLLPALDQAGVRVLVLAEGFSRGARATVGEPRLKHPNWLGEILPDDAEAGYLLAKTLTEAARKSGGTGGARKLHVGLLSGDQSSAGLARFRGWARLKAEARDVEQTSFQYAGWERDEARSAATLMLRTQPDIDVIWAANDAMALGALDAARATGRAPGKDLFLGGIDLGYEALVAISEGSLTVSLGGHFLDGARAILLVHDHHRGRDFEPWSRRSPLVCATPENAGRYRRFFEDRAWRTVDFTRFSRALNPAAKPPDLSLDSILLPA